MKIKCLGLLAIGVLACPLVATAGQVTSGNFFIGGNQSQPSLGGHFVGEGFDASASGPGGSTAIGRYSQVGDVVSVAGGLVGTDILGIGFNTMLPPGRGDSLFVYGSSFTIVAGQLLYTGTFTFEGTLCIPNGQRQFPLNCDIADMPPSTGYGFYEAEFRLLPAGTLIQDRDVYQFVQANFTFVPEPATLGLFALGLIGFGFARRRSLSAAID